MDNYAIIRKELDSLEEEMLSLIPSEPSEVYGFLPSFLKRGGKRVRPALAFTCNGAVGGRPSDIVRHAAIIELFHNFTLIHDDIEDSSQMRRGEPTLHMQHGIPLALNSGDALYTVIFGLISNLKMPPLKIVRLSKFYTLAFRHVVEGQGIELSWYNKRRFDISEKEYFRMIWGKTAALLASSCELGAFLGGGTKKEISSLRLFGEKIGLAFQIQDDVLNVTGTFEKYKKEIGGDISEGKRTLMVIKTLENCSSSESEKLRSILVSNSQNNTDISYVIKLFEKYGAIDYAAGVAKKLVSESKEALFSIKSTSYKDSLVFLADYVIRRET